MREPWTRGDEAADREMSELKSLSFTPALMKFEAKILIVNTVSADLDFQKVDYAVDLYDTELFANSFSGLNRVDPEGNETVTFPLQIAMSDLAAQAPDLLAEGSLRVRFRGQVFTAARFGMVPVPFERTLTSPIPRLPELAYAGSQGEPFSDSFRLVLEVTNTNPFPFTVTAVKTFLEINGKRYSLLHTVESVEVKPGETAPVVLRMENSPGKTLSMILNLAQNHRPEFNITGTVTFNTPYGWIFIPVTLREALQ